jgi:hypothetical protein
MGQEHRRVAIESKDDIPQGPIIGPWLAHWLNDMLVHITLLWVNDCVALTRVLHVVHKPLAKRKELCESDDRGKRT